MIDYGKFAKALQHLQAQFENYRSLDPSLPGLIQEAVAESVIQRFETTYDCLWKVLKRHLVEVLGIPEAPNSPKPIFRLAHENRLLPGNIEDWLEYANRVSPPPTMTAAKRPGMRCGAWMPSSAMPRLFLNASAGVHDDEGCHGPVLAARRNTPCSAG